MPKYETDTTQEQFDDAKSLFVVIPPGKDGEREGDQIRLACEVAICDWKTPNVSLMLGIVVTEEGVNKGKDAEMYPGVTPESMWKTKPIFAALGVNKKVFTFEDGKMVIDTDAALGAKGKAVFTRIMSNNDNLRSVLTDIEPL